MKAARSVNHRGLPGGGGLRVCMRRLQKLYGPRGKSVRARALRSLWLLLSESRVLALLAQSSVLSVLRSPLSRLGGLGISAPRAKSRWGVPPVLLPAAPCVRGLGQPPACSGPTPHLARAVSRLGWLAWFLRTCPPPPITPPPFVSADELVERAERSVPA